MDINISFEDQTIVVDDYGCKCLSIKPLKDEWLSLQISGDEAKAFTVDRFEYLEDYSFINPWVSYVLNDKKAFEKILVDQENQRKANLANIERNKLLSIEFDKQYQIGYNEYLRGVKMAEEAERQRITEFNNNNK